MKKRKIKKFQILIILWLIASLWGAINIFSAGAINQIANGLSPFMPLIEQLVVIIGMVILLLLILRKRKPPYKIFKKYAVALFNISLVMLLIVVVAGTIVRTPGLFVRGGAKSTIPLGFTSFQPLELYKITMILFLAKMFSVEKIYRTKPGIAKASILSLIGIALVFIEPDLGGAILLGGVFICMLFYNGQQIGSILKFLIPTVVIGILLFMIIGGNYQVDRIYAWLHPFSNGNDLDISYNVVNGYVAISNGGALGSGFMNSIQKTGFLFASNTDFIFTVICEEWGIFGAAFTIGILLLISLQCFNIGYTSHERFGMLYAYGFGTLILVQTFVNVGGVIGLIPMTGVTLPFVSKGMNSFVILSLGLFYVIILDKERIRQKRIKDERTNKLFMS